MKNEELKSIIRDAVRVFGPDRQTKKAVEEMAELTTVLMRFPLRGRVEDVITEIADVFITTAELAYMYGNEEVLKEIEYKARRLRQRIDEEEVTQKQMKEYYGN